MTPEEVSPDKARHLKKEQAIKCMICDLKDDFQQEEKDFQKKARELSDEVDLLNSK